MTEPQMAPKRRLAPLLLPLAALSLLIFSLPTTAQAKKTRCPQGMVSVLGLVCIDPFEEHLEEKAGRRWKKHLPFEPIAGKPSRALSKKGVYPQAYISRNEAEAACEASHKRLCTEAEWVKACKGKETNQYPYGKTYRARACNDSGASPLNHFFGTRSGPPQSAYGWGPMNDPRLNRLPGSLAKTGQFQGCRNKFGVYDLVGNLHEWISDTGGTFRGGYYLDTKINGEGCDYRTVAHNADYHDYSTGFRCCADPR